MASKFRSKLEARVAEWMAPLGGEYESHVVSYSIPKVYTPDFTFPEDRLHVEVKGWFRAGDRQKYKAVSEACREQEWTLVFILQNPGKLVSKGAKSTMADWCDNNGIIYFSADDASGFEKWVDDGRDYW